MQRSPRLAKLPTGPVVQTVAQLSVKVEALCRRERSGSLQPKSRAKRETSGFESRRVHSPICGEDLYRGENAEIISPSNLTLFPPPPILKLTESCTTFLMTPDSRGHLRYHQTNRSPSIQSRGLNCRILSCRNCRSVSCWVRASASHKAAEPQLCCRAFATLDNWSQTMPKYRAIPWSNCFSFPRWA